MKTGTRWAFWVVACLLASVGVAGGDSTELRFDPFEVPELGGAVRPGEEGGSIAGDSDPLQLRGLLVAGPRSLADLGGTVIGIGDEAHGHKLLEVREAEAVFEVEGTRVVIRIPPLAAREGSR